MQLRGWNTVLFKIALRKASPAGSETMAGAFAFAAPEQLRKQLLCTDRMQNMLRTSEGRLTNNVFHFAVLEDALRLF